jgi:hypothetical protein
MARELNQNLAAFLQSGAGSNFASWCEIILPELPGSPFANQLGRVYRFATAGYQGGNLVIDNAQYEPYLKTLGEIKRTTTPQTETATITLINTNNELGNVLLKDADVLHGATVRCGRWWEDPKTATQYSYQQFKGVVDGIEANQDAITLTLISDLYAARTIGGGRKIDRACQFVFNSPAVRLAGTGKGAQCAYTGTLTTCNKLYDDADGCSGRSNQAHYGGFVKLAGKNPVSGATAEAPNYQRVVNSGGTTLKMQPALKFTGATITNDNTNKLTEIDLTGSGNLDYYFVDASPYNAVGDGSTDDNAVFQQAHDDALAAGGGIVYMGAKEYAVTNLQWDSRVQLQGAGLGVSVLKGTDSTKAVIEATGGTFNFFTFSNFTIEGAGTGSNNHGIYTHSVTDEVYMARFYQLEVKNCGGKGIFLDAMFSCHFDYVFVTNCGDNLFDLKGGNTIALYNCYADDVAENKTGYRVHRGQVTMVNCNGIDSLDTGTSWAVFGDKTSEDGTDAYVDAILIGCNVEEFKLYGVRAKEGSRAEYYATFFTASSSGSAHVAILHDYTADNPGILASSCRFNTNGGTWANSLPIHSGNDMPVLCLGHGNQTQYYYDGGASTQTLLRVDVTSLGGTKYVDIVRGAMNELAFNTDGGGDIGPSQTYRPQDVNATRYIRAGSLLISVDGLVSSLFSNSASAAPIWSARRGRGTSGSPSAVQSDDAIGYIEIQGQYDTGVGDRRAGAYITASATENWDSTHAGTKVVISVAPNGSTDAFNKKWEFDGDNGLKRPGGAYIGDLQAARVYRSSTQSVNNITWTAITFDSEIRDDGGFHSTSSNTDRMTAPATGWYQISANIEFVASSTGSRMVRFYLNGTTEIARAALASIATYSTFVPLTATYYLTASDYVTCDVFQDSGGSLNVGTSSFYQIHRVY